MQTLREKIQNDAILSAKERQAILSGLAKSPEVAPADKIKSIDVLNKMTGEYITKIETTAIPVVISGEEQLED